MASIGIDIGSYSIKVAKVRSSGRGYDLVSFAEYPLSSDPTKDNQLDIIEILRDVQTKYIDSGDVVVLGAHQFELSIRRREFPFRERHKILKSLPFELEDDIPFSPENAIFDAKITHFQGNKANVLAVACPKEHISHILKRASDAGVTAEIVSADGIAFSSMFEEWRDAPWEYPASEQAIPGAAQVDVIINIGHESTIVSVIKDGYVLDVRHIDWGGKNLAENIARRYSIHYVEALKELKRRAFILTNNEGATRDQVALSDVVKTGVDELASRLRLILYEMRSLYAVEFRQAIVTGGVANLRNLGPYLTQKIEIATNKLGQLDMLSQLDFAGSPNGEIASLTAIGLAVEGIRRPKNPALNLLRGDFAKKSQSFQLLVEKWGYTAQMIAAAFFVFFLWGWFREDFAMQINTAVDDELLSKQKSVMGESALMLRKPKIRSFIKEQENKLKIKAVLEGLQDINSSMDVMQKISAVAPAKSMGGLNISKLEVNSEKVVLIGEAANGLIVNDFMKNLKSIAKDGKVTQAPPPEGKKPNYKSFQFEFRVNRKGKI